MAIYREMLGDIIREERTNQGLTLRKLSIKSSVSLGYLSEVERGHKEPSSEIINALAGGLQMSAGELVIRAGMRMAGYDTFSYLENYLLDQSNLVTVE